MTVHENQSSGVENLVLFAGRKMSSKNPKNSGTICIWSNDATDMLIELWSEETIKFAIENSKISGNERGIHHATGNAPINVKPAGEGGGRRRGIGRDFDRSLWPGGRAFELSCCPGGRDI